MLVAPSPVLHRVAPDLQSRAAARATRWGGRCFRVPRRDRVGEEDRVITLPDAMSTEAVLVPRGHGWPLVASRVRDGWRAVPGGEPCGGGRWEDAGGIAAWIRRVELPVGPARAVAWEGTAQGDHVLAIRLVNTAWAAVRRSDPSVGNGVVAVGKSVVRGVSPAARSVGVESGMSMRVALRRCPRLRVVPPRQGVSLIQEVVAWLGGAMGPVVQTGGVLLVPWSADPDPGVSLARQERLLRRLWQAFGVEANTAVAASARAASVVVRMLDRGEVAAVPSGAEDAWSGRPARGLVAGARQGSWTGPALPDVEGILSTACALLDALGPAACVLRWRTGGRQVELEIPEHSRGVSRGRIAEPRLRVALARNGPVDRLEVSARKAPPVVPRGLSPQLALLAGVR